MGVQARRSLAAAVVCLARSFHRNPPERRSDHFLTELFRVNRSGRKRYVVGNKRARKVYPFVEWEEVVASNFNLAVTGYLQDRQPAKRQWVGSKRLISRGQQSASRVGLVEGDEGGGRAFRPCLWCLSCVNKGTDGSPCVQTGTRTCTLPAPCNHFTRQRSLPQESQSDLWILKRWSIDSSSRSFH